MPQPYNSAAESKHASLLTAAMLTAIARILAAMLLTTFPSSAQEELEQHPINFYIPANAAEFPNIAAELAALFKAEGLLNVSVKTTEFWHPYERGLRNGHKGVYFAQPHYAAWVIHQHNFNPVLKLHGHLNYVLAVRRSDAHLFELRDLAGSVICRGPGLNLGTVWLNSVLGKRRVSVISKEVMSVALQVEAQQNGVDRVCDAFVLSSFKFKNISQSANNQYVLIAQSPKFKHSAIVGHPELSESMVLQLKTVLKSNRAKQILKPYLEQLGRWQNLLPVKEDDYDPSDADLLNVYWRN